MRISVTLFLIIFIPLTKGFCQERQFIPSLGDHKFITNRICVDPFIKSSFRLNVGVGQSSKDDLPPLQIVDTVLTPESGSLLFVNLSTQFSLKLHEKIAYLFRGGFTARVGTEPISLYSNGLNTLFGIQNYWKIKLYNNDKNYLSTMVGVSMRRASLVNLSRFINDLANDAHRASINQNINVLRGSVGLYYAYAFNSIIGMNAMLQYTYGDSFEPGKSEGQGTGAIAFDFNLYPKTNIPLGLSVAYGFASMPEYTSIQFDASSIINSKLAYTGSDDLIISFDVGFFKAPYLAAEIINQKDIKTNVTNFALNIVVFFD